MGSSACSECRTKASGYELSKHHGVILSTLLEFLSYISKGQALITNFILILMEAYLNMLFDS